MKDQKERWLLLLSIVVVLALLIAVKPAGNGDAPASAQISLVKNISHQDAYALVQENAGNTDFVILDVRTLEEYTESYINGSVNIDFYSEGFRDELDKLDKNKTYLVYCRSGRRSGIAVGIMEELGFEDVYNMLGGIKHWEVEGQPVIRYTDQPI